MNNTVNSGNQLDDEIDLGRLLGLLFNSKWLIASVTVIFAVLGVAYVLLATPIYEANSLLQIENKSSGSSLIVGDISDILGEGSEVSTELELLKSRLVLGKTVEDLNLTIQVSPDYFPFIGRGLARLLGDDEPAIAIAKFEVSDDLLGQSFTIKVLDGQNFELKGETADGKDIKLKGESGKLLVDGAIQLLVSDIQAKPGQEFKLVKQGRLNSINKLKNSISVSEVGKQTNIVLVKMEGSEKDYIRDVVAHISQNYLQQNVMRNTEEAKKSLEFLDEQLPKVRDDLDAAELRLNDYRQEYDSIDLSLEAKSVLDTLVDVDKQLNELTFKEAELQQRYTKQHPAYKSLLDKRETLLHNKKLINQKIKGLPKTQQEILRLRRDVEVDQQIFIQLLNKQQELNILKAGNIGNVRIVDSAVVEPIPVAPKKSLIVLIATLLGAMLSVGFVLLRAALHKGIESPDQLEEIGVSVYVTVPFSTKQKEIKQERQKNKSISLAKGLLAIRDPADLSIEALRGLRTNLHFAMLEAKNNIILISGPAPNIGKSFISANLAAILAMGGKKVLLIDSDLRRGHLHNFMSISNNGGLSAYLAKQIDINDLVKNTGFSGLDFINRGDAPPNPSELLMGSRMGELFDWASQQYDFVLIDSAPILAVTDAAIIAQHAGTSLLVARYSETTVKEVEVAIQRFEQNNLTVKGVLLNAVEKRSSGYYGNYGYYQYSYRDK